MAAKTINDLKAPEVHYCVKSGFGMKYLCEKYDCSEEQVVERIRVFYRKSPHTAAKLVEDLRRNDKAPKAKKSAKSTTKKSKKAQKNAPKRETANKEATMDAPLEEVKSETTGSKNAGPETEFSEELKTEETNSARITIEELTKAIDLQSQKVANLELQRKTLRSEQHKRNDALRKILAELDELEKAALAKGEEYDRILAENRESEKKAQEISAECKEEKAKLNVMRDELEVMTRIEIYIYDDETISVSDEGVKLDDSEYEKLSSELMRKKECRTLRIWEIELLARTIKIAERLGDQHKVELVFENPRIEAIFAMIMPAKANG